MCVGEGLHRSFATPDPFVLTNKICLNQESPGETVNLVVKDMMERDSNGSGDLE